MRQTIFDHLERTDSPANKYCRRADLTNEASVESFFVMRLLKDLGYRDSEIKTKKAVPVLAIPGGHRRTYYQPDYLMELRRLPRWVLDAKSPDEELGGWVDQCSGYALVVNRKHEGKNPVRYYALTNGISLNLYPWDSETPLLEMDFADFVDDNPKFLRLRELVSAETLRRRPKEQEKVSPTVVLRRPPMEEVKRIFNVCHRIIWKTEKLSPSAAFFEFVKIMFIKLWEDRQLHNDPELGPLIKAGLPVPKGKVVFSTWWVDSVDRNENPIDALLFRPLVRDFEEAVARREKKPVFNRDERIKLGGGTVREVVSRLEKFDFFGIDEDLNGRLFETFLSATMRGKALGQFFTPRSIVKLMTRLAGVRAYRGHIDRVLDACCGTGGFLIEVLADMRNQVRADSSLSESERRDLQEQIANNAIFGIDAGREPPIARIARINMYLHGDGGSRIYSTDALDKELVGVEADDDPQVKLEVEELRQLIVGKGFRFDAILTNPPFSMDYAVALPNEARILSKYELAEKRQALRSSTMFLERYADLLEEGGKLLTVIDDSILSTDRYAFVRDFIRHKYVVRGVISLSGDAFQRVGARAKTSVLYLVKRRTAEQGQPDVFMVESQHVGLDDVPPKTRPSKAKSARENAEEEIRYIVHEFEGFLRGEKGHWLVPASAIKDRLDVKSCLPRKHDVAEEWAAKKIQIIRLRDIVEPSVDVIEIKDEPDQEYVLLRIRYDGVPEEGDRVIGRELTYEQMGRVHAREIALSNIAAVYGSVCVIPPELEHTLVSSEFTVLRITDPMVDPFYLSGYLRSPEVRARLLSKSTGISRHRIGWEELSDLPVPLLEESARNEIAKLFAESIEAAKSAERTKARATEILNDELKLNNRWALERLKAAKPPK